MMSTGCGCGSNYAMPVDSSYSYGMPVSSGCGCGGTVMAGGIISGGCSDCVGGGVPMMTEGVVVEGTSGIVEEGQPVDAAAADGSGPVDTPPTPDDT